RAVAAVARAQKVEGSLRAARAARLHTHYRIAVVEQRLIEARRERGVVVQVRESADRTRVIPAVVDDDREWTLAGRQEHAVAQLSAVARRQIAFEALRPVRLELLRLGKVVLRAHMPPGEHGVHGCGRGAHRLTDRPNERGDYEKAVAFHGDDFLLVCGRQWALIRIRTSDRS